MSYRANTSLAKKYVESEQQITHLLLQLRWDYTLFAMEMDRLTDEVKQRVSVHYDVHRQHCDQ